MTSLMVTSSSEQKREKIAVKTAVKKAEKKEEKTAERKLVKTEKKMIQFAVMMTWSCSSSKCLIQEKLDWRQEEMLICSLLLEKVVDSLRISLRKTKL